MPTIEINDLASQGVIKDVPSHQIPPEAWTLGENVRLVDDGVERLLGWTSTFGSPPVDPHFTMPISTASQTLWPWVGLAKAYVWDGTNHTDITRLVGGDYNATKTADWNGTVLGGVAIFNNGIDDPQFWATAAIGTKLAKLTNWPANTKAKVIRAFGPYLVGLSITKSGTVYPHMVKWSHPADPGSVPISWDETDPTKDTGEKDLEDIQAGGLVDALPLQATLYLYKQGSTWKMTHVGGQFIFQFEKFLETSGILAPRCACITGDGLKHVVATQDDIIVHNGNVASSILSKRQKRTLAAAIDTTNYANSFMFCNPIYDEVWFCYPSSGMVNPNKALIWNYKNGDKGALTDADITFVNGVVGPIEVTSEETWASVTGTWADDTAAWSELSRRKVVVAAPSVRKFYLLDTGLLKDTANFNATLQRDSLSVVGQKRNGEWIVDFERRKFIKGLWPKIKGGPVNIRAGYQENVGGPVTWSAVHSFDPATQMFIDLAFSGRSFGVEFSTSSLAVAAHWRIDGYKVDLSMTGRY